MPHMPPALYISGLAAPFMMWWSAFTEIATLFLRFDGNFGLFHEGTPGLLTLPVQLFGDFLIDNSIIFANINDFSFSVEKCLFN